MIRIEITTYGESVISTPSWEISPPSGPMQNGTTYMTRPRMQPSKISAKVLRISSGAIQLLVGPASSSRSEQMNVRSSTRATSPGSEAHQKLFGRSSGFSRVKVPFSTSRLVSRSHSACEPSHQTTASGLVSSAISLDPPGQLGQPRRCLFVARACAGHGYHSRRGLTCGGTHDGVRVSYP